MDATLWRDREAAKPRAEARARIVIAVPAGVARVVLGALKAVAPYAPPIARAYLLGAAIEETPS